MTRHQPSLRPIISTNIDVRPRRVTNVWHKHYMRRRLSANNFLKTKNESQTLGLQRIHVTEDPLESSSDRAEKCRVAQGTQTTDWLEEGGLRPGSDTEQSFRQTLEDELTAMVHRKHAERRGVLERVERDLQERSLSRPGYWFCRLPSPTPRAHRHTASSLAKLVPNHMAPLISETTREPRRRDRGFYNNDDDDVFYQSPELPAQSQKYHKENNYQDTSPTRDQTAIAVPGNKRGKLVTFFKNGDPFFRGFTTSVNERDFRNYGTLLQWLTEKVQTPFSVRFVFSLHDGREVKSIEEFRHSRSYVLSGSPRLNTSCTYGPRKQTVWSFQPLVADKIRNEEIYLYQEGRSSERQANGSPKSRRPRILTIISNLDRSSREKLILNPQTALTFEDLLSDLSSLVRVPRPPVRALYTERPPHIKIESYSQLLREYKDHANFIACGEEGKPTEMTSKRHAPDSNSSTESTSSRPFRKPRKFQRHNFSVSDASQSQTDSSVDVNTAHAETPFPRSGKPTVIDRQSRRQPRGHVRAQGKHQTVRLGIHGRKRDFYAPSILDTDDDGGKPDKVLKLDWVYGYRGKDARCNLFVVPSSGELLYFVGAVAVLYDRKRDSQRHYCGHSEDITCMALHPGKRLVASGQQAGRSTDSAAHVRIWDTMSLSTYSIVGLGEFRTSVSSVAFSVQSQGDFVLVVDDCDKHSLSVWDWQNSKLVVKTTTTTDMVVWGRFHNLDDSLLVTFGKKHVYFWRLFWTSRVEGEGRITRDKESGVFEDDVPKFVTSLVFSSLGDVVVGDSNGNITVWSRDVTGAFRINHACSDHMLNAHRRSVFSLCFLEDGILLSGGGSEIKTWDSHNSYQLIKERVLPDSAGYIRTMVPASEESAEGVLYIGTTKNYILEGSLTHKFKFIVQGHSDKLRGLTVHPTGQSFFTAGSDQQVRRWSATMHSLTWRVMLEKPCVSVCVSPDGRLLAVGTADGRVVTVSAGTGAHISSTQVTLSAVSVVKFSPNCLYLAAGCDDGNISVYEVMDDGFYLRKTGNLQGHKNAVMQLDWSSDNRYIQAVSSDYDLFYWEVEDFRHVSAARTMRDVDWSTQTCVLSYNTIGPWTNVRPGEDVRCVCRSAFRDYLATGTNVGAVQLYKYPSSVNKAQCYSKKVFSSEVTGLQFGLEDRYLLSAGGSAAVLLQWALKPVFS